mmetsp:Transcript_46655/g.99615  ORF Transcript_46655/g.99615 Transcript_46655/m.99615 type:complete len:235 (-) Transcript_46655:275-979(-)
MAPPGALQPELPDAAALPLQLPHDPLHAGGHLRAMLPVGPPAALQGLLVDVGCCRDLRRPLRSCALPHGLPLRESEPQHLPSVRLEADTCLHPLCLPPVGLGRTCRWLSDVRCHPLGHDATCDPRLQGMHDDLRRLQCPGLRPLWRPPRLAPALGRALCLPPGAPSLSRAHGQQRHHLRGDLRGAAARSPQQRQRGPRAGCRHLGGAARGALRPRGLRGERGVLHLLRRVRGHW